MTQAQSPNGPPVLDPMEQRILGSLMEKRRTVPGSYPMTLNALRLACNQSSSREPVVDYDDTTIEACARALKQRELLRVVVASRGVRTLKYHERLSEQLDLAQDETALVTVLLLRGPQAPGELKTRTERLHAFADRADVESCLQRLACRIHPLVRELPRRAGQHDNRWIHLLGPVDLDEPSAGSTQAPVDWDAAVLAEGAAARDRRVLSTYDAVAPAYAEAMAGEMDVKPFDAWLLTRIAGMAAGGPVADVGCGPGHTTAQLSATGAQVIGYDLSARMIDQARQRYPSLNFEVGDLTRLLRPRTAAGWSAITAWYSLVHLTPGELPEVLTGLGRVLLPGGFLGLAVHLGSRVEHWDSWFAQDVCLDLVLHDPRTVRLACDDAGFVVEEWYIRSPLEGLEIDTERLYLLARKT